MNLQFILFLPVFLTICLLNELTEGLQKVEVDREDGVIYFIKSLKFVRYLIKKNAFFQPHRPDSPLEDFLGKPIPKNLLEEARKSFKSNYAELTFSIKGPFVKDKNEVDDDDSEINDGENGIESSDDDDQGNIFKQKYFL